MLRIYGVSDIHTDYEENLAWLKGLKGREGGGKMDALLIAGDVTHRESILKETLGAALEAFRYVAYVPGNHDLWKVSREDGEKTMDKLKKTLSMCRELGVIVDPTCLEGKVWVVPVMSWHHMSWDKEPDITGWEGIVRVQDLMADYRRCDWGGLDQFGDEVAVEVDKLNEGRFDWDMKTSLPVVSMSHFLPFQSLCPEKRFLYHPNLPKAVGSTPLATRLLRLSPTLHLFGHTHFTWDATHHSIRCIQSPLAYPHERSSRPRSLKANDTLAYTSPLLLWDEESGFAEPQSCWWSEYYKNNERTPQNTTELAPYVSKLYTKTK